MRSPFQLDDSPPEATAVLQRALARLERVERAATRLRQFVPDSVQRMIDGDEEHSQPRVADVTTLFLDVQGYCAWSDRLAPQELASLIECYFSSFVDAIYELGGDINETAGDGLMVLFEHADPRAHAVRAARAALAVMERTQTLAAALGRDRALIINIGISSGEAAVGARRFAGRRAVRCTYTATGAVTNRAARLQAEAHDGAVLVAEDTAHRIDPCYHLADLGYHTLRNLSEPQRVFRLLAARSNEQCSPEVRRAGAS